MIVHDGGLAADDAVYLKNFAYFTQGGSHTARKLQTGSGDGR